MTTKGLIVSVLRPSDGDFSLGGLSATHQELTVVNIDGPFGPRESRPAVMLTQGPGARPNPILIPAIEDAGGAWRPAQGWWMFGGNYAASSDSRFAEAIAGLGGTSGMATKVHDRIEVADEEVRAIGSEGMPVVIGSVRRRGMTWFALDRSGGCLSEHVSEGDAAKAVKAAASSLDPPDVTRLGGAIAELEAKEWLSVAADLCEGVPPEAILQRLWAISEDRSDAYAIVSRLVN